MGGRDPAPGLRLGQAGVRRARQGRRGRHPRGGQLPHPVQERQGRGRHRRAHVPARPRHGDVRQGDGQAAERARRRRGRAAEGCVPRHQVRALK
ncbi:hydroxycinnamoyltransferase13 [Zea mays]|uniref:Hydroxycinnamoyltransferase13 n=1 Tax=Zea mays TaxID=4577 RepID=A0A1D6KRC6_MAIZE|nr:hydroxycinnamoyltransferase13 [Zea mays]